MRIISLKISDFNSAPPNILVHSNMYNTPSEHKYITRYRKHLFRCKQMVPISVKYRSIVV